MCMSKCRVVLTRFYVFVEKQRSDANANLPFHVEKKIKNDVCSPVPPGELPRVPRRDAPKGGTPRVPKIPPGSPRAPL